MGSEPAGIINSGTKTPPRLCYHALPSQLRPERHGMATPPLQAPGSVPFGWEEEPGKPRISDDPHRTKATCARSLELPPRLAVLSSSSSSSVSSTWRVAKVADAGLQSKAVLEGPYYVVLGSSDSLFDGPSVIARSNSFSCSSFSFGDRSLRHNGTGEERKRRKRPAGWLRKRAARRRGEGSPVRKAGTAAAGHPPSSTDIKCYVDDGTGTGVDERRGVGSAAELLAVADEANVSITRFRRSGSLPNLATATTHLWASLYGGLKHVVTAPWRSRKSASKRWSPDPAR